MTLTSDISFNDNCVRSISLILFEIKSQFWCMNASWDDGVSCTILWVTVTLTSDLLFRKIVSVEYLILLKGRILNLVYGCNF